MIAVRKEAIAEDKTRDVTHTTTDGGGKLIPSRIGLDSENHRISDGQSAREAEGPRARRRKG